MEEIDRVIRELEGVRDMLRNEGERVSREIAGYASLSHASMTAMKVIADSLKQWKDAPINPLKPGARELRWPPTPSPDDFGDGRRLRRDFVHHDAGRRLDQQHFVPGFHVVELLHAVDAAQAGGERMRFVQGRFTSKSLAGASCAASLAAGVLSAIAAW